MIMFRYILLTMLLTASVAGFSQVQISGIIVDSLSFKSLPHVHIRVKKTGVGIVSDENGYFHIKAKPFDTLIFSTVGYFPFSFPVLTDEEDIMIMMSEEVTYLQPILVTGSGIQSPFIKERKELVYRKPNPVPLGTGSGISFDYFTKAQREKRRLLKVVEANDRVRAYAQIITDQDFRELMMGKYDLTEDDYYNLVLTFNVTRIDQIAWKDEEEVIEILESFFCSQSRKCP